MCFGKDQACKHENGRVDPQALIFWASRGAMRASTSLASAVCRPQSPGDICLMPSDANSVMLLQLYLCGAGPGKIGGERGPEQV